ncbi:MAG TPA: hypothetical protein VJ806_08660 [Luteimonas sp.]|nr:hypothetical protein [Luteimonas sp.]
MSKSRRQLDVELGALAAAAPYLKHRAASPEEFRERLNRFVAEIRQEASEEDMAYVESRAAAIADSPKTAYQTPHS